MIFRQFDLFLPSSIQHNVDSNELERASISKWLEQIFLNSFVKSAGGNILHWMQISPEKTPGILRGNFDSKF